MSNNTAAKGELQLDISNVSLGITELDGLLAGLKETAENVGAGISEAFAPVLDVLNELHEGIAGVTNAFLAVDESIFAFLDGSSFSSFSYSEKVILRFSFVSRMSQDRLLHNVDFC